MNSNMNKEPIQGIKCDVTNCYYNCPDSKCVAGEIKVGPHHANSSADTVCSTFKPEMSAQ